MRVHGAVGHAPSSHVGVVASAVGPFTPPVRHFNIGSFRFCDADDFREDCLKVPSFVGAESSGDVFPYHVSRSNISSCPSKASVTLPHLLHNSDLFHEKPGAGRFVVSGVSMLQALSCSCHAEILTGGTAGYHVHGFNVISVNLRDVSKVSHSVFSFPFAASIASSRALHRCIPCHI